MSFYKIKARARIEHVPSAADIYLYSDIGGDWYDDSGKASIFVSDLNALDTEEINIRINSYGGSVTDGIAIYNALRRKSQQGVKIITHVDSAAFSIASLIAMAGEEIHMADNAIMMIHAPWTYSCGNAEELRKDAATLDKWAQVMQPAYERVCGDADKVKGWLTDGDDHYFTASEALAENLIHEISSTAPAEENIEAQASKYKEYFAKRRAEKAKSMQARIVAAAKPVPAAPAAFLKEASKMNLDEKTDVQAAACGGASNPAPELDRDAIAREALAADRQRRADIAARFAPFAAHPGAIELRDKCADEVDCTPQAAGERLLAMLAKGATPTAGSHVITVEDAADKQRKATEQALLERVGAARADGANPMRGMSLYDMARASLQRAGVSMDTGDKMRTVSAAFTHSSSDFPSILENVANKAVLRGYEGAPTTFGVWTSKGTLPDFRPARRVGLGFFGRLPELPEGAEYKHGTIGERGETIVLKTYGSMFSITRQAIINDDVGAFTKIPARLGREAAETINHEVYAVLRENRITSDNKALFCAEHGNLLEGAAISTDSVSAMRTAMMMQRLDGVPLNIRLKYLIVPPQLEDIANTVRTSQTWVGANGKTQNTIPNIVNGSFEVIVDGSLADMPGVWYGAADPAAYDGIEVAYLDGNENPYLEQKDGWNVDGVEFKVRHDFGVAPLDFRTFAMNPGA